MLDGAPVSPGTGVLEVGGPLLRLPIVGGAPAIYKKASNSKFYTFVR